MQLQRWRFAADYAVGTLTAAVLDATLYASTYGHPALVPSTGTGSGTVYTGAQVQSGSLGTITYQTYSGGSFGAGSSANWSVVGNVYYTSTNGATLSFTTTARQLTVQVTGIFAAGMGGVSGGTNATSGVIHNGAIARLYLDGVLIQSLDSFNATPIFYPLTLDGTTHTIVADILIH